MQVSKLLKKIEKIIISSLISIWWKQNYAIIIIRVKIYNDTNREYNEEYRIFFFYYDSYFILMIMFILIIFISPSQITKFI